MLQETAPNPVAAGSVAETLRDVERDCGKPVFNYNEAFSRNLGLINEEEQEKLRNSRVAIAGMGGVGGIHLITLARLGIGKFTIADPDTFELANMNRQYGCRMDTLGRSKAEVMAEEALRINPDLDLRIFEKPLTSVNVAAFLQGADLMVDAIDAFSIGIRRQLFRLAAGNGIHALGAGPVGFSTAWVVFSPNGMSYDRYFDFSDGMDHDEEFVAYIAGMVPKATQRTYLDARYVNISARTGPSVACACQLAAGVIGAEVTKILLRRGPVKCAPHYFQIDPFVERFVRGYLWGGNKHPLQRLKRWLILRHLRSRERTPTATARSLRKS